MNSIFKIFLSLLILVAQFEFSYAQTASILPPAQTTFVDKNGKPLTSGTVEFFIPGTTTRKMTWRDAGQTIPNANPLTLDGSGRAIILGDGSYRQVLKDRNGNVVWDGYTASTGSGGGGTTPTVGDGDAVGTIKPWAGFIAPYGYVFTYGQELTRASYPEAFAAITSQQNVTCTIGNPTLTGVGATEQLPIGAAIESSCLNTGATILSKTINSITATSNAVISTTTTARFFPYGNGDGSLTFNIPDLRGRAIAGRDNMGGIVKGVLTSTYYGSNPDTLGANGGSQSQTLTQAQLPSFKPAITITDPGHSHAYGDIYPETPGAAIGASVAQWANVDHTRTTAGALTGITAAFTNNLGNGDAHTIVQPTQTSNYIIKIIPDSNPNSFFGVASIGGMYGVIECGFGITCAGNTISAVSSVVPAPTLTTLGGIFLSSAPVNQFGVGVDSAGNLLYAQPSFNDISGIVPYSKGGTGANLTASNGGILWSNATTAQILAGTANASRPLISGSTATPSWAAFSLPGSVTSGGVAYFSSTSAMSSSALLAANQIMLGGGAGTAPATLGSLGTTTTVLHGNAGGAPTFGQIVNGDVTTNTLANSSLIQTGAATIKGNPTAATANVQDFTIQGLTNLAAPDANLDFIPIYDHVSGTIKNVNSAAIAGSVVSGVASYNGRLGVVTAINNDVPVPNYLTGLTLSTAGSSSTFGIAVGFATDSTNVSMMALGSAYTKTTSAWAVGSTNGALDTGTIANSTWYHVFLMRRPDTGVVDICISLSSTSCTTGGNIPVAYTQFRRIGSMLTNGSAQWTKFVQNNDQFLLDVNVLNVSASPGTTAIQTITVTTPLGVVTNAILNVIGTNSGGDGRGWIFSPDVNSAGALATSNTTINMGINNTSGQSPQVITVKTNTSSQIKYAMVQAAAAAIIVTTGWIDTRGK